MRLLLFALVICCLLPQAVSAQKAREAPVDNAKVTSDALDEAQQKILDSLTNYKATYATYYDFERDYGNIKSFIEDAVSDLDSLKISETKISDVLQKDVDKIQELITKLNNNNVNLILSDSILNDEFPRHYYVVSAVTIRDANVGSISFFRRPLATSVVSSELRAEIDNISLLSKSVNDAWREAIVKYSMKPPHDDFKAWIAKPGYQGSYPPDELNQAMNSPINANMLSAALRGYVAYLKEQQNKSVQDLKALNKDFLTIKDSYLTFRDKFFSLGICCRFLRFLF